MNKGLSKNGVSALEYSDTDLAQFDSLARFDDRVPEEDSSEQEAPTADTAAFQYTGEDDRQFAALMKFEAPGKLSSACEHRDSYTNNDRKLFDQLAPDARVARTAKSDLNAAAITHDDTPNYTPGDIEAFHRLNPGEKDSTDTASKESGISRDRDVGTIRIVDADKERDRKRRFRNRRNAHIKVRYFE